jgi:hypothetical protein
MSLLYEMMTLYGTQMTANEIATLKQRIADLEAENAALIADNSRLMEIASAEISAQPPQGRHDLRMLGFELEGVLTDVKHGGFDAVCLETVQRVRYALHDASKQEIQASK